MKKILEITVLLAGVALIGGEILTLQSNGVIPSFPERAQNRYTEHIQPTEKIREWSDGFVDGFTYDRIPLKPGDYHPDQAILLTQANQPSLARQPWWWGASANGKTTISFSGSSQDYRRYEIHDPQSGLLFIYSEW